MLLVGAHIFERSRRGTVQPFSTLNATSGDFIQRWKGREVAPTFRAPSDITLSVQHSQTPGLSSCNGSGKSTLLKLLGDL